MLNFKKEKRVDYFDIAKDIYTSLASSNFDPVVVKNLTTRYGITDQELRYFYLSYSFFKSAVFDETSIKIQSLFDDLSDGKITIKEVFNRSINLISEEAVKNMLKNKEALVK